MKTAEELGKLVREVWIQWAREQPTIKEHWLTPWERLSEPDKDVDRRIGLAIQADAYLSGELAGMMEAAEDILPVKTDWENAGEYTKANAATYLYQRTLTARDAKSLATKEGK